MPERIGAPARAPPLERALALLRIAWGPLAAHPLTPALCAALALACALPMLGELATLCALAPAAIAALASLALRLRARP